jgi:hypothetical protein
VGFFISRRAAGRQALEHIPDGMKRVFRQSANYSGKSGILSEELRDLTCNFMYDLAQ